MASYQALYICSERLKNSINIIIITNNNVLEEDPEPSYTKSIQEKQPPYWCQKS
jgi:hypothetical protein